MANRRYNQYFYSFHNKPVMLSCKYQVLASGVEGVTGFSSPGSGTGFGQANPNNLGFGTGITNVQGFSSAAAADNFCASGNVKITLADNYTAFYGAVFDWSTVVTGAAINVTAGLVVDTIYQIVTLGTTTQAQWQTLGVPVGTTAAVGVTFQAITAAAGTGTGTVKAVASGGITDIEVIGDPNLTITSLGTANGFNGGAGGYILLGCYKNTVLTQPADGTIVHVNLLLGSSNSLG